MLCSKITLDSKGKFLLSTKRNTLQIKKKIWLTKLGKYKGLGWYSSRVSSILLFIDTDKKTASISTEYFVKKSDIFCSLK